MEKIKVLSLFDGISCGMAALERKSFDIDRYVAYEINPHAIQVSKGNYKHIEQCGDVFDGDFKKYKGFDLVIGGSPCTFWSLAKVDREITREGEGYRLFKQFLRAIDETKCTYFLYENNFSIHKDIKKQITKDLGVNSIIINSSLVSAQARKREYWTNIPGVKQPTDRNILLQDILEYGTTERKKSKTVRCGGARSGWGNKHEWDMPNESRIYTTIELERLQTLPDNYTKAISDNKARECIGNGWTVDVIAHILGYLKEEKQRS